MTRPGFRKGRSGGGRAQAAETDGFLSSSLFSQAQILHLMKNEFARARRHGIPLGVVLLQVDRLPQLVDLHGAGLRSTVKQAVAGVVRDKTRGSDLLGTTNDDRYLLVLPHTDAQQTRLVAERIYQVFSSLEVRVEERALALSVSVGITACDDRSTLFFDSLLSQAESALRYAMDAGGDQVVSFAETTLLAGADGELPLSEDDFALPEDELDPPASEERRDG
ncbi:MAG: hypothetical protein CMJ88_11265 [Planctomycetes bacterium]|nr:hypothetical protein [Planctomycetota bacterium]